MEEEKCWRKYQRSSIALLGGKTFSVCEKKKPTQKDYECSELMGVEVFTITQTLCTMLNSSNINVWCYRVDTNIWKQVILVWVVLDQLCTSVTRQQPASSRALTRRLSRTRRPGSHWSTRRKKQSLYSEKKTWSHQSEAIVLKSRRQNLMPCHLHLHLNHQQ